MPRQFRVFNQHGDLERAMLRRGNHNSAKFWRRFLLPVIERNRDRDIPKYFRGDAAFAIPALYRWTASSGSVCRRRWCSEADATTGRKS